jgi:ACS family tartrate transporter-like MFS transporter
MNAAVPDNAALEKRAYRKASLRILPLIGLGYGISYIDRVNISFASLQMNRDLNFSSTVYGFGAGLFFLSYAACEVPSNLLLYRFGARRWLARIMVSWGIVAMAMAVHGPGIPGDHSGRRLLLCPARWAGDCPMADGA